MARVHQLSPASNLSLEHIDSECNMPSARQRRRKQEASAAAAAPAPAAAVAPAAGKEEVRRAERDVGRKRTCRHARTRRRHHVHAQRFVFRADPRTKEQQLYDATLALVKEKGLQHPDTLAAGHEYVRHLLCQVRACVRWCVRMMAGQRVRACVTHTGTC